MANQYPFDPYGINPANLIQNEQQVVTRVNDPQVSMVVPNAAPFFRRDLEIRYRPPGVIGDGTIMVEGVDYFLGWKFIAASRTIGESVFGAVILTDPTKTGSVLFKKYRTLGDDWVQSPSQILDMMNNILYHPRVVSWDEITPQLVAFPVIEHPHDISDLRGVEDLYNAILQIPPAIVTAASTGISNHLAQTNPHNITKYTINMNLVENYAPATTASAALAVSNEEYMTPYTTRVLLETALGSAGLGGLIFGGGGSAPVDGADVTGPNGGVLANEIALFDGTTGKFIKGTTGTALWFTAADRRGIELRTTGAVRAAMRFVAAGGRIDLLVPSTVTGNYDLTLPVVSGTLVTQQQLQISQGRIAVRTGAGVGLPDAQLTYSVTATADSIAVRKSNGQLTVSAAPQDDTDAVSLKYVSDNYVPNNADLFLRVATLQNAAATPSNQNTYSSVAITQLLSDYVATASFNQWVNDQEFNRYLRDDTELFIRVNNLQAATDVPTTTKTYSSSAVQVILGDYASKQWVNQQLEDLGLDPDPEPTPDPILPITIISALTEDTQILRNTMVIVENVDVDGVLIAPSTGVVEGDRFAVAIVNNKPLGTVITATLEKPFYQAGETDILLDNAVVFTYQYNVDFGWIRTSVSDFYSLTKPDNGADLRYSGLITLEGVLPDASLYSNGTVLEISTTETFDGVEYKAGTFLFKKANNEWLHVGGVDDTNLIAAITVLTDGFNNLTAALQL